MVIIIPFCHHDIFLENYNVSQYQRSRNVTKWDESDVDEVLPAFVGTWEEFPPRLKREVPFEPRPQNQPVGTTIDISHLEISEIWLKMFRKTMELVMQYTNTVGHDKFKSWKPLDWPTFLEFNMILMRMGTVGMKNVKHYFFGGGNGGDMLRLPKFFETSEIVKNVLTKNEKANFVQMRSTNA
ncbi:MAG: hypothetical protein GY821_07915 [Gammaproteobacteria bacterium]|nr:hypothetical protein [Gammaproteobacteria bacterium]